MAWTPVETYLGDLPTEPTTVMPLPIPVDVKGSQILVYSFITIQDIKDPLFTGYYRIFTKDEHGTEHSMYMNAPYIQGTISNSENFWLPYGTGFDTSVYVSLVSNGPIPSERKTQHRIVPKRVEDLMHAQTRLPKDQYIRGQVFITGIKN